MVPCATIIDKAREEEVDIVGLSGLITPSLDEMVQVAKEFQHEKFEIPLLIGGATTSTRHTAVKIAPQYTGNVVHVADASRAAGVVDKLLNPSSREAFAEENRKAQARDLENFQTRQQVKLVPYKTAVEKRWTTDWSLAEIETPEFLAFANFQRSRLRNSFHLSIGLHFSWLGNSKESTQPFSMMLPSAMKLKLFDDAQKLLYDIVGTQT